MNKTTEQIKALLDSGFKEAQIKTILDVTDDDILIAMGVEGIDDEPVEEEEPKEEPKEEPVKAKKAEKRKYMGATPKFTEEDFNEMRKLKAEGLKLSEIAERLGFSESYIATMSAKKTYAEVVEFRARQAKMKRVSANKMRKQIKELSKFKEEVEKAQAMGETKEEYVDPKLAEFRSMADSLARIAEAFEKIAEQPKKRGLFRK